MEEKNGASMSGVGVWLVPPPRNDLGYLVRQSRLVRCFVTILMTHVLYILLSIIP